MESDQSAHGAPLIWLSYLALTISHTHLFPDDPWALEGAFWVYNLQTDTTAMVEETVGQDTCTLSNDQSKS